MAKLENPLSREEFQALKGIVDFYYWKGVLIARKYPETCNQPGTPEQLKTWQAFKDRWQDFKLLQHNAADGFKTLSGGSDLTWVDCFTKYYLRGWYALGGRPPVIYGVKFTRTAGFLNVCVRINKPCRLDIMTANAKVNSSERPYVWVSELPTPAPPNCSIKWTVLYTWEKAFERSYTFTGAEVCYNTEAVDPTDSVWFQIVVRDHTTNKEVNRTGVFRLDSV